MILLFCGARIKYNMLKVRGDRDLGELVRMAKNGKSNSWEI